MATNEAFDYVESVDGQMYQKQYDYTQYSHVNHVNVIPEKDFKHLVEDTFRTITDTLRSTYGPYGSTVVISSQSETTTTKDGYNVFESMGFSHAYKRMVYLAIAKICERVNRNVGDGTTSCVLLAEKMFKAIEGCIKTPDDKRNILAVLNDFESELQKTEKIELDRETGMVKPLTIESLMGMLQLSGNYDNKLSKTLLDAIQPNADDNGVVTGIRNVVVEPKLEPDGESITTYNITYLPGDYRIRVHMDPEAALLFENPRKIRVALYDHKFGMSDWNFFMSEFDKETETLIIARTFDATFMDNAYVRYCKERELVKQPVKVILCEVKGNYFKHEIADLAAVLNTDTIGLHAQAVDHAALPIVNIQVVNGNCMCFFTDFVPTDYIEYLQKEMESETSESLAMRSSYRDRIHALSNKSGDTMIVVKSGTSLELKMIHDKIDDCVSIVQSALMFGVVPNMLVYGHHRILNMNLGNTKDSELASMVQKAICDSIIGLFHDIWVSKHGTSLNEKFETIASQLYSGSMESFDVVKECFIPTYTLPTSAQYDLEVIVAAISIVKYLLTSRALVFDAHLMTPVNDVGSYRQI